MEVENHIINEDFAMSIEEENPVEADAKTQMDLAFKVLQACLEEDKAKTYLNAVQKLLSNFDIPTCSSDHNKMCSANCDELLIETTVFDIEIRQIINKMYITHEMPTIEKIKRTAKYLSQNTITLKQQLRRSGYIFKRINTYTKRVIIVEDPKQALLRQQYLTKIIRSRKEGRHLVYVWEKIITANDKNIVDFNNYLTDEMSCVVFVLVISNDTIIYSKIFGCNSLTDCQETVEENFLKHVLPRLDPSSLIVLEEKPFYRKSFPVPTINSEKKEMIKWLEFNNIPHDEGYHRSELFELIQRYKNKRDLHKFDVILKANDHDVIRRPVKMDYLNYFRYNCRVEGNQLITPKIIDKFMSKAPKYWAELDDVLINTEKVVFDEDLKVENIIERIINMANMHNIEKWADEFDEDEDCLKQDELIVKV